MKLGNNLASLAGLVLGGALLLDGCVGDIDGPRRGMTEAGAVIQDDYVYYPGYQTYYSNSRHEYVYQDGPNWVYRQSPRDVSVRRLHASPSVKMDFHDSPATHHQDVLQQYPKNWSPSHPEPGHQDGRNDDRRDNPGR